MKIYKVKVNGKLYEVELESVTENKSSIVETTAESSISKPVQGTGSKIVAPMSGNIIKVNVSVNDKVSKGQCLCVLEAMKLENEIVSPVDGVVSQVLVNKGATVSNQQVLIVIG